MAGLIHDAPTVAELIDRIMAEADALSSSAWQASPRRMYRRLENNCSDRRLPDRLQFPAASDFRNCVSNTRRGANWRSALSCHAEPAA